jgi:tetratricopeptide (TPR) repeat protein
MGYFTYYLVWIALAYAVQHPFVLLGAVLVYLFRGFLPDPVVYLQTSGRIRALRSDADANPSNVRARRDLAELYLLRMRPKKALAVLDEARRRAPDDAELLYLTGVARVRSGDPEGALEPLVRAVDIDPRIRFGEPYLVAAKALVELRRLEEAVDALEHYVRTNTSSVQAHARLALLHHRLGDRDAARSSLREALATWSALPGFRRRKEIGWWLRAQAARLWI